MNAILFSTATALLLVACTPRETRTATSLSIEPASEAQAAKIRLALGNDYPVSRVLSIKSTTHERAYYVGAEFNAEGVGNVVGIWLMGGSKEEPNLVLSVDGVAHQFSRLGKASDSKAGGSIADPEAKALTDALKQ